MFKHILFATDGSNASEHAAHLAISLARTHGAKLTAVYVVDPYPFLGIGEANPMGFQAYMDASREASGKAFSHVADLCKVGGSEVALECTIIENMSAHRGIIEAADTVGADLLVVGSHGRGGLQKLVLGSVATKVVAQSSRPVLIAR